MDQQEEALDRPAPQLDPTPPPVVDSDAPFSSSACSTSVITRFSRLISHERDGEDGSSSTCIDPHHRQTQEFQAHQQQALENDWVDSTLPVTIPCIPRPRSLVGFAPGDTQPEEPSAGTAINSSDEEEDEDDAYLANSQQQKYPLKRPQPLLAPLPSIPRPLGPGDRTTSTARRLRGQGFRSLANSGSFAVRSIRRGSDDWRHLIKPFVSDLVFRSVICRPYGGSASSSTYISGFRPYTCHAAVLFVDFCSYSRITAAIAHKGAHYISTEVNAYLKRLLHIIQDHGGDVVKFAGDAVLIVWEGTLEELPLNVLCAAKCVLELFDKAGSHVVAVENATATGRCCSSSSINDYSSSSKTNSDNELVFRIHCGLTCGRLHSEIFEAPTSSHMQRLYHIVGGETVEEMGYLVDLAAPGQVCCSKEVLEYLPSESSFWIDTHQRAGQVVLQNPERKITSNANNAPPPLPPPSALTAATSTSSQLAASLHSDEFFEYTDSHNDDSHTGQEDGQDDSEVLWSTGAKILTRLELDPMLGERLQQHITRTMADRSARRNKDLEEDFIHPSVLHLLCHGGLSPTQIAQMRNLCVLFIGMTSNGSSLNWLMEVQQVLDKKRCPIVQLIFDDKGVHIVAAVNLYESVPETGVLGLEVCRELVDKQVGCAIGMALGSTFCGVTGSVSVACRWDITGPPAVRAARLMQYALSHNNHQLENNSNNGEPLNLIEVAIDQSVYQDPLAATRMQLWHRGIFLKGTAQPCPIYTLSTAKDYSAFRVLETAHARVHDEKVRAIQEMISFGAPTASPDRVLTTRNSLSGSSIGNSSRESCLHHRCAVLVTGPSMVGKKIVCQRAAGYADLVPFLHVSDVSSGLLQLARTISTWYNHVAYKDDDELKLCAQLVFQHLNAQRWSRAHDECIRLVELALERGVQACFLVDRVQFLDEFSLSLIRECLRPQNWGRGRRFSNCSTRAMTSGELTESSETLEAEAFINASSRGRICFLCVHVSLYHWRRAHELAEHIGRSNNRGYVIRVPIVEVGPTDDPNELRTMFRDVSDMEVAERWLRTYAEASGSCAGYFIKRAVAIRTLTGLLWQQGETGYAMTTEQHVLQIPTGKLRENKRLSVLQVSVDAAMKFFQIYDELPPLFQTFGKVLTIATQGGFYQLPRSIMWEVLNDLIAEGCEAQVMSTVIDEMVEMYLIKNDTEHLSFLNPAMADIIFDVCTPVQVQSMTTALIQRLEPIADSDFRVPLLMATLYHNLNDQISLEQFLFSKGYRMFLDESKDWSESERNRWKEIIDDEIQAAGHDTFSVLGSDFHYPPILETEKGIGPQLPLLKMYSPPISFGPMGHSLAVLCRNICHEFKAFDGASRVDIGQREQANKSASNRYLREMAVVETFLNDHGLGSPDEHLTKEKELIQRLAAPATNDDEVQEKANWVLNELIPVFVEDRLRRLYQLIVKHREGEGGISAVMQTADLPLRLAYEALHNGGSTTSERNSNDAAQDALMTLATMNYKPKQVPEDLPFSHYQTVARIRNKVLRRLSDAELAVYRHQQSIDDLEVFLVVTSLLYQAADEGRC